MRRGAVGLVALISCPVLISSVGIQGITAQVCFDARMRGQLAVDAAGMSGQRVGETLNFVQEVVRSSMSGQAEMIGLQGLAAAADAAGGGGALYRVRGLATQRKLLSGVADQHAYVSALSTTLDGDLSDLAGSRSLPRPRLSPALPEMRLSNPGEACAPAFDPDPVLGLSVGLRADRVARQSAVEFAPLGPGAYDAATRTWTARCIGGGIVPGLDLLQPPEESVHTVIVDVGGRRALAAVKVSTESGSGYRRRLVSARGASDSLAPLAP